MTGLCTCSSLVNLFRLNKPGGGGGRGLFNQLKNLHLLKNEIFIRIPRIYEANDHIHDMELAII